MNGKPIELAIGMLLSLSFACGGDQVGAAGDIDRPTVTLDPALVAHTSTAPGPVAGTTRVWAAVADTEGRVIQFAQDELMFTGTETELQAFLNSANADLVQEIASDLEGIPSQYLVRIDGEAMSDETLQADLASLAAGAPEGLQVSSPAALGTIAQAARLGVAAPGVGLNWRTEPQSFLDRTSLEAPEGPEGYSRDAFDWETHDADAYQQIGVAEAWRALQIAEKLRPGGIQIGFIDSGFAESEDLPPFELASGSGSIGRPNVSVFGEHPHPWHGLNVAMAAMALPDNQFGSAGPDGPVARGRFFQTRGGIFGLMRGLAAVRSNAARIVNVSKGVRVPALLAWTLYPFDRYTQGLRKFGDLLIFAAAGNDGEDVDKESCFAGFCVEDAWHAPCENEGVICVGGVDRNSPFLAGASNFGSEHVDIFAPFYQFIGPDPDHPENRTRLLGGTSFASAFVAGVAALIKVSRRNITPDSVERALLVHMRHSQDPRVRGIVNADHVVKAALGKVRPLVEIVGPNPGTRQLNHPISFWAQVVDLEDGANCCAVTWTSDLEGELHVGDSFTHAFSTLGTHTITARTKDSDGLVSEQRVILEIENSAPEVAILQPGEGVAVFRGAPVLFRSTARDTNEPNQRLACDRLRWESDDARDFPAVGCDVQITFRSNGRRTLTVTARDPQGLVHTDEVVVEVVDPPPDLPPTVVITSPGNQSITERASPVTLNADVSDDNDAVGDLDVQWFAEWTQGGFPQRALIATSPSGETWTPSDNISFRLSGTYVITVVLEVRDSAGNFAADATQHSIVVIN